jgi:hypothetical protein
MSDTLATIKRLANKNEIQISEHGYDELAEDGILVLGNVFMKLTVIGILICAFCLGGCTNLKNSQHQSDIKDVVQQSLTERVRLETINKLMIPNGPITNEFYLKCTNAEELWSWSTTMDFGDELCHLSGFAICRKQIVVEYIVLKEERDYM